MGLARKLTILLFYVIATLICWSIIGHQRITPLFPEAPDEAQQVVIKSAFAENEPDSFITESGVPGYCFTIEKATVCEVAPSERVDEQGEARLTKAQRTLIAGMGRPKNEPWWLWRSDNLTYSDYNQFVKAVQGVFLTGAFVGLIAGMILGGFRMNPLAIGFFCLVGVSANLLYLIPGTDERLLVLSATGISGLILGRVVMVKPE